MKPLFKQVSIVGVGLIGGSLGMALKERGLAEDIVGSGSRVGNLRLAVERGAIHRFACSLAEGVSGADLVVIATPVSATIPVLEQIIPHLAPGVVVTDVGSTKADIVSKAEKMTTPDFSFIGGHPMAGSEQNGVKGADPYLFENAFYIITPTAGTPVSALERVKRMVSGIGARIIEMDPADHDLAAAAVSHLPHLLAATLVNTVVNLPGSGRILPLAAGGFKDTTRIAAGSPSLWRDIFAANREQLLKMVSNFKAELEHFEKLIKNLNKEEVYDTLNKAREVRLGLPQSTKGYLPSLYEVIVTVPDQPGAIAGFTVQLAGAGVNISDIEILRVREGEGGTIRVGFATTGEQDQAVNILRQKGYAVKKR